jgi:hypothetical protein
MAAVIAVVIYQHYCVDYFLLIITINYLQVLYNPVNFNGAFVRANL